MCPKWSSTSAVPETTVVSRFTINSRVVGRQTDTLKIVPNPFWVRDVRFDKTTTAANRNNKSTNSSSLAVDGGEGT